MPGGREHPWQGERRLGVYLSIEEVMEQFDVTREQITAVLEFDAQSLKASGPVQTPVIPAGAHPL